MATSLHDLECRSLSQFSNTDFSEENRWNHAIDQMIFLKRKLDAEDLHRSVYLDPCFVMDKSKLGNKRFVIRQPEEMKEWRQAMKELLRQYLVLKIPEEDLTSSSLEKFSFSCMQPPSASPNTDIFEIRFKMKIDSLSSWYRLFRRFDSVIILQKRGSETMAPLSQREKAFFQESFFSRLFQGNHLEYIKHHRRIEKIPDSFWSDWKWQTEEESGLFSYLPQIVQKILSYVGNWSSSETLAWTQYQKIIHPAVQKAALNVLNHLEKPQVNVVELCGGEGDLASGIVEQYRRPMNYYLLEYNDLSLQRAASLIASKSEDLGCIVPIKTDVANPDDYFLDQEKKKPMQAETIDLIIGCGALAEFVLESKEKALAAAKKCHELLTQNGKMILAGLSFSFLDSEDFSSLGFRVINRSFVGKVKSLHTDVNPLPRALRVWNKQFYILEKI